MDFQNNNLNINESSNINFIHIQKMVFIYNALLTGWTVKSIGKDKFEFLKPKSQIKKEINLGDYLKKFIKYNLSIENLTK